MTVQEIMGKIKMQITCAYVLVTHRKGRIEMAERKIYSTKARTEILEYLKKNWSTTVSAADILQELRGKGMDVNQTTVYRYLERLCAERIAIKYADSGGEKAIYQFAGDGGHCTEHLHLRCVKCGRLVHLDCGFMEEFKSHLLLHHDFHLQCEGNILHGVCNACAAAKEDK